VAELYIIKIGGNVIDDEGRLSSFLHAFAEIKEKKLLVHGGGKLATRMGEVLGIQQKMIDGRRVTDAETLKVVTMVYAGFINKNIVAQLQSRDCNAIGLSGADGNALIAHKRKSEDTGDNFGFVGDIDAVNAPLLRNLLDEDLAVVICPITHDGHGQLLNTNADTIAQELAKTLGIYYDVTLIYCFEKAGVLMDAEDDNTLISVINRQNYDQLKSEQKIFAGMIPKLDNAFSALNNGVKKVIIGKADHLSLLVDSKTGTTIVNE
jgi:acetylglutamate kinase